MTNTRKIVLIAVLASLGAIIGLFEAMIPLPFAIPGFRLGLSNIVVLVSLVILGYKEGIVVAIMKSIVLLLLSGNVSSFIYSLAGSIISSIAMSLALAYGSKIFSMPSISIIGALGHNIAQVSVSALILKNIYMFTYLPVLMVLGIFTGIFVGISSAYIIDNLKKNKIFKE